MCQPGGILPPGDDGVTDLISIGHLSALVEDQYCLLGFFEDHRERLPPYDPIAPERNQIEVELGGATWTITAMRGWWECCHREARRTVVLEADHPSPFDIHPRSLLRFVLSVDERSQLNEIVLDNWILKFVRAGRLTASRHREGYYTFA
jgi:hypothetical protein